MKLVKLLLKAAPRFYEIIFAQQKMDFYKYGGTAIAVEQSEMSEAN